MAGEIESPGPGMEFPAPPRRQLTVVSEEPAPRRPRGSGGQAALETVSRPEPAPAQPPTAAPTSRGNRDVRLLVIFEAVARILAVRLIMLLGVLGAFVLAVRGREMFDLWLFIAYCLLVVVPLVGLDFVTQNKRINQ
jgi:hypothetical protein